MIINELLQIVVILGKYYFNNIVFLNILGFYSVIFVILFIYIY